MDTVKMLLEKANRLPMLPGVYIMLDDKGEVIYVGKAKKLKNRVSSYFHGDHLPKVAAMVAKAADFQVIVAASEFEALVLENSLIKRHRPHYNILLQDDKGYPFIRLDRREEYPRMEICSRAGKDGAEYYGPFGGRSQSREIIDAISKALLLPDCSRSFPRDIGKERPCLNYHLDKCAGWCLRDADAGDYRTRIEQAALILDGKSGELVSALQEEMLKAAEELRFERAGELRDRIRAIEGLQNRQRVIATAFTDTDAVGFRRGAKSCFTVLHFVEGDLIGKDVETVQVEFDGSSAQFHFGNTTMICRLVVGKYPKYRDVIPQNNANVLKIDRTLLLNTVRRVAVCSNKASNHIKFSLKEGQLEVSAQDLGFALAAYEKINCDYAGDELTIGFKSTFLTEILSNMGCNGVVIKFADARRAALILPSEEEAESEKICGILMPIMIS